MSGNPSRRELDVLLSTGEQVSIALLCMYLTNKGCAARSFTGGQARIRTDTSHTKARIQDIDVDAINRALGEAAKQSAGLATDVVTKVGTPLCKMPVEAGKKLVDWVSQSVQSWFGAKPEPQPETTGARK